MTSSVETKVGGVNNFIYASIIGVYVPGRDQSCFILRLFSFFCTEQCTILVSTVNYSIRIFVVDEFSCSWFVLAKLNFAGFVGELAGKWVCHGNCGPNPQTAGHLGCLNTNREVVQVGRAWYFFSFEQTQG